MKINIVNYEEGKFNGILSKYAYSMKDSLIKLGHDCIVSRVPNDDYEVNHHINYLPYQQAKGVNTLMVTHFLDNDFKVSILKDGLKTADLGICFSEDTKKYLKKKGIKKLDVVLPAHDSLPRRMTVIAITTNVYPDGCKRQWMLEDLAKVIDKSKFGFRIMGKDWKPILEPLVAQGLQVEYMEEFDPQLYKMILDSADYYLYFGEDEGSMGALDAKQAGLKLITTNQGFHKDLGVDFPFKTQEELNKIFKELEKNPVEGWTWENYCKKHIEIWEGLLQ